MSQCSISLPGSIAATLVERPTSIEEGFPQNAPMVYHFGHTQLDKPGSNTGKNNSVLYDEIVSEMAGMVKKRLAANKKTRTSGIELSVSVLFWLALDSKKCTFKVGETIKTKLRNILYFIESKLERVLCAPKSGLKA